MRPWPAGRSMDCCACEPGATFAFCHELQVQHCTTATSGMHMPEVRRPKDGVRAVKDPAAAAGALRVIRGMHDRDAGQQAAQDERQQHAMAPRACIPNVYNVPTWLSLRCSGHQDI